MKKKTGFTLAEVLITLAIIGIIAALVIPAVMTNFQFRNVGIRLSKFASTVENATRAYVVSDAALPSFGGAGADNAAANQGMADYINQVFSISNSGSTFTDNAEDNSSGVSADAIGALPMVNDDDYGAMMERAKQAPSRGNDDDGNPNMQNNEIVLKDGTRAHLYRLRLQNDAGDVSNDDAAIWGGHNNPGVAVVGQPVLGIVLDPIATGVPANAHRMFAFVITQNGFVFPAGADDCLYSIVDSRWETRQETFTGNAACASWN